MVMHKYNYPTSYPSKFSSSQISINIAPENPIILISLIMYNVHAIYVG